MKEALLHTLSRGHRLLLIRDSVQQEDIIFENTAGIEKQTRSETEIDSEVWLQKLLH